MSGTTDSAPVMPGNAGRDDYPRMLYHPDGGTAVAATVAEHDKLHAEGWATQPYPVHRKREVAISPIMSGSDPFSLALRAVVEAVLDERGLTAQFTQALLPPKPTDEPPLVFPSKGATNGS